MKPKNGKQIQFFYIIDGYKIQCLDIAYNIEILFEPTGYLVHAFLAYIWKWERKYGSASLNFRAQPNTLPHRNTGMFTDSCQIIYNFS